MHRIRKIFIEFLALSTMFSGMKINVSAETTEYYTSNYNNNASITISGDAILHVDADKTLSYINVTNGSLIITGEKSLTVNHTSSSNNGRAVYLNNSSLTVDSNTAVNIINTYQYNTINGIYMSGDNASIVVEPEAVLNVTCKNGTAINSVLTSSYANQVITVNGTLIAKGYSTAIRCNSMIVNEGGSLSCETTSSSIGLSTYGALYTKSSLINNGGSITVAGISSSASGDGSTGIYCEGDLILNKGTLSSTVQSKGYAVVYKGNFTSTPAYTYELPVNHGVYTNSSNEHIITDLDNNVTNNIANEVRLVDVYPTKLTILDPEGNDTFHRMFLGTQYPMTVSVAPEGVNKDVIWEISNPTVAEIDENGYIKGLKEGTISVTAKSVVDNSVKDSAVMTFVDNNNYDFTGSKFKYSNGDYTYGYLDYDHYEYSSSGHFRMKDFSLSTDAKYAIHIPYIKWGNSVESFGNNEIISTYNSADDPGVIIKCDGAQTSFDVRLYDGSTLSLIDNGCNMGIETDNNFHIYSDSKNSIALESKLNIQTSSTGIKAVNVYSYDICGSSKININAKIGIDGNLTINGNDKLEINASDYGIKGYLYTKTNTECTVNAMAESSEDKGIAVNGRAQIDGTDDSGSATVTLNGSTQALLYQYPSTLTAPYYDNFNSNYSSISYPNDYSITDTTIIDNTTSTPAKKIVLKTQNVNVNNGTGSGEYPVGSNVTIKARDILGYKFTEWELQNTRSVTDGVFQNADDNKKREVSITVPEGRTRFSRSYSLEEYSISYSLNGGTVNGSNPMKYTINTDDFTIINPTRPGSVFVGWYSDSDDTTIKNRTITKGSTGDITLIAVWRITNMAINCSDTDLFTEHQYQFTCSMTENEFLDDPSFVWSSSNTSIAKINASTGVLEAIKPGAVTITARNAESNNSISKEITIYDYYDFDSSKKERGDLETEGFHFYYNQNNLTGYLSIKNLNLSRNNEYVIKLPGNTYINYYGNNVIESTYTAPNGEPGNLIVIVPNGGYRSATIEGSENNASLKILDNGFNNGFCGGDLFFRGSVDEVYLPNNVTQLVPRFEHVEAEISVNNNGICFYEGVTSKTIQATMNMDLTINADSGIYDAHYIDIFPTGRVTINARNYGIKSSNSLRVDGYCNITVIAEDENDAGIAYSSTYGHLFLTGNQSSQVYLGVGRLYGSKQAVELFGDYLTIRGVNRPADYSFAENTIIDNQTGLPAKEVSVYGPVYTITYELNGGTVNGYNPVKYSKYSTPFTLINPEKDGYVFAGWKTNNSEELMTEVAVDVTGTSNLAFTAYWTVEEYTLSYDLNGGILENENPAVYTVESETIVLNYPTKEHYEFTGWLVEGTDNIISEITAGNTGNKVLVAQYTPVVYQITYDYNGGQISGDNPVEYTIETESFTLNEPKKKAYDFVGWIVDGVSNEGSYTVEKGSYGDLNLKAMWTPTVYTITYELNGGYFIKDMPDSYTVETETFIINEPERAGYRFLGWLRNGEEAGLFVPVEKGSTGNIVLRAQWDFIVVPPQEIWFEDEQLTGIVGQNLPVTVSFYPDDTTNKNLIWTTGDKTVAYYEDGNIVLVGKGSTVITAACEADESIMAECSITVSELTVEFNSKGGSEVPPLHPAYNTTISEPESPVRNHYTFDKWYYLNQPYDFSTPVIKDLLLTASWKPVNYNIVYNLDGGEADNPIVYNIETESFELANPEKENYEFIGWTGSNGNDPQKTVQIPLSADLGELQFTANYIRLPDSITLNKNSITMEVGATDDLSYTILPNEAVSETISWTSSNESVVTVDDNGLVTAVNKGIATITVSTSNGKSDYCVVTVKDPTVYVVSIKLSASSIQLRSGEEQQLIATIRPSSATNKTLVWSSSNESVATVDQNGVVRGIKAGNAVITATTCDGSNISATCAVIVSVSPTDGTAYAVLTDDGDLIFFRSIKKYSNLANTTVTDINGKDMQGIVFTNVESGSHDWTKSKYNKDIIRVLVADNTTICPTTMESMFEELTVVQSIDLNGFNTSSVTNMQFVFYDCSSLKKLNINDIDTSSVTSMWGMFYNCNSLTNLDVSGFNTSNVNNMAGMFEECSSLINLNLSNFNTGKVTSMNCLFSQCNALSSLNLTNIDTQNVTDMSGMFEDCTSLTSLDVSHFDTSSVTDMYSMFNGCHSLKSLDISSFNTSYVTNMNYMFYGCSELECIVLGSGFTNWINESYLPAGNWTNGEIVKTETELYNQYPSHAFDMKGTWVKVVPVTSITFNNDNIQIEKGQTAELVADILPSNATLKKTTWSSSDESIVTVNQTGTVVAVGIGKATITVTTIDGSNLTATCEVNVYGYVWNGFTLNEDGIGYGSYTNTLDNSKHSVEAKVTAGERVKPTCEEEGSESYVLYISSEDSLDNEEKTEEITNIIPALGHMEGEAVRENEVEPTCEEDGSYDMAIYCTRCGEELSRTHHTVYKLGHSWGEWEITKEPTCTEAGEETRVCENDSSHKETREVESLGHEWGEWAYDGKDVKTHTHTCTHDETHKETEECVFDEGVLNGTIKTYTCQVCGGTYTENITEGSVVIQSSALVLEGVIQIQFKVLVPEAEEKNIVVKFEGGNASNSYEESYNAAEKRVKSEETAEGMVYYYRVPVYAKQMNDKVTIWFTDLEGNKVSFYRASGTDVTESGFEYSVATYINNKWDSSTTKTRNLVRAMKYYGLYAQKVFTYEVSLADEILSTLDPMSDVDISLLEPYAYVKEGTAPAGLKVASFSLTLEEDIRINYKLDVGEGVNPEDYDIRLDGNKVKAEKSGSEWYVYKANIAAKDLDTMHELSISDGTNTMVYRYGVLTYCYNKLSNSNTDANTKNLCKSIYWYSKAADAYWGN